MCGTCYGKRDKNDDKKDDNDNDNDNSNDNSNDNNSNDNGSNDNDNDDNGSNDNDNDDNDNDNDDNDDKDDNDDDNDNDNDNNNNNNSNNSNNNNYEDINNFFKDLYTFEEIFLKIVNRNMETWSSVLSDFKNNVRLWKSFFRVSDFDQFDINVIVDRNSSKNSNKNPPKIDYKYKQKVSCKKGRLLTKLIYLTHMEMQYNSTKKTLSKKEKETIENNLSSFRIKAEVQKV